jgi:hypothetical protein
VIVPRAARPATPEARTRLGRATRGEQSGIQTVGGRDGAEQGRKPTCPEKSA